jgi:hypothetical protein
MTTGKGMASSINCGQRAGPAQSVCPLSRQHRYCPTYRHSYTKINAHFGKFTRRVEQNCRFCSRGIEGVAAPLL